MRDMSIRSQDIVLAVHLLSDKVLRKQSEYAGELGISQGEISMSLKRLERARLIDSKLKLPYRKNLKEFLVHGLKYVCPPELGPLVRGIPTAHSAAPLSAKLSAGGFPMVWPSDEGDLQGQALAPLHPCVPKAALRFQSLYERLALIDSIRMAKPRETQIAIDELEARWSVETYYA